MNVPLRLTGKAGKIFVLLLPLILAAVFFLSRGLLLAIGRHLPACPFYTITGYYCPACGNTRSVTALLHGDILSALRYNITPVLLLVAAVLFYGELAAAAFGKNLRFFPRNSTVNFILLGLLLLYYLIRNFIPYLTP